MPAPPGSRTLVGEHVWYVGIDLGSPVSIEYYDQAPFRFNGKIEGAQVRYLGADAKLNEKEERGIEGPIPVTD